MKKVILLAVVVTSLISLLAVSCGVKEVAPTTPTEPISPTEPTPAAPAEVIRLKWADGSALGGILDRGLCHPWCHAIETATEGRVKIDIFGAETLLKSADTYDGIIQGIVDVGSSGTSFIPGRNRLTELMNLPFTFKSSLIASLTVWELYEEGYLGNDWKDTHMICLFTNGVSEICSRNPIRTLEDWKGQKFAALGYVQSEMCKLMGATPVYIVPPEWLDCLQKGVIDFCSLEWEGLYTFRTHEATKYRTDKVGMTTGPLNIAMNLDVYNNLPADIRAVIDEYSGQWIVMGSGYQYDRDTIWRRDFIKEYDKKVGNPEFYILPEAERNRWIEAMAPLYDKVISDTEAQGLPARDTFNKMQELSAKYAAMYPPGSEAEYAVWQKYGAIGWLCPGYPKGDVVWLDREADGEYVVTETYKDGVLVTTK